ncbi:MAG: hypothetical protein L0Y79_08715 [Chlorobi bacterium]|nr:hypothetical protein [Chlorobiota bacterium]MCI0716390.1 hypothetical protein [Chlorobiota bacterium]
MASGPSKEELEMYWKSSRQYFDELAAHYKTADPDYYNKFILPFYTNPFIAASSGKKSGGARAIVLSMAAFAVVLIAGIAVFFISYSESDKTDNRKTEKKIESPGEDVKENTKTSDDDMKDVFPSDDFLLGSKYLAEKDYDKAEEYLKKIKPGDKDYEQAQQLLKSIKYLRKYDPKK